MRVSDLRRAIDAKYGRIMIEFMEEVFPICRSITGDGLRETLAHIGKRIPLELTEVASGTEAFDWVIPPEWNVRDAWLADASGRKVVDFGASNLHLVNYSVPVRVVASLDELRPHLHTLPDHPTWVPYRTSYYSPEWGFCLADEVLRQLPDGEYEAFIDTTLHEGSLTYGECLLPGSSSEEILVSSHVCHPSLANDNLSGVAVALLLASLMAGTARRYTYRFLFAPGTIGAIAWLAGSEAATGHVRGGLVLACVGDEGPLVYKRSRRGDVEMDRAAEHVLATRGAQHEVIDFSPYGNDERQFCSPGFDLAVGALTRSGYDRSERHHTSADDLASISAEALTDTLETCLAIFEVLEGNATYSSCNPKGEPQLGRRGLYRAFGGRTDRAVLEAALLWVMSFSDGAHSLLDIARRAGLPFEAVAEAALALEGAALIRREEDHR